MNTTPDFLVDSEERIKIWFDTLLDAKGKSSREDLTAEELASEIKEVKGTIANEQLWAVAEPIHIENVEILTIYLEELNALLERALSKSQDRKGSLDEVIRSCEDLSKNGTDFDIKNLNHALSDRDL